MLWSHYAANVLRRLWTCEYCLGAGVKGPPLFKQFKVYGTWQLVSPNSTLCTAKKKKDWETAPKWWVKSMIKHFYRHKRQTVVFSHVKNKTDRCWNPCKTNTHLTNGCLKDEALKGELQYFSPWSLFSHVFVSKWLMGRRAQQPQNRLQWNHVSLL